MFLFKKKKVMDLTGNGGSPTAAQKKQIDVLNYNPIDYTYTREYTNYWSGCEAEYRKEVNQRPKGIPLKVILEGLFEDIHKNVKSEKNLDKGQYARHLDLIDHHRGIVRAEIRRGNAIKKQLLSDKAQLESELAELIELKKKKNENNRTESQGEGGKKHGGE